MLASRPIVNTLVRLTRASRPLVRTWSRRVFACALVCVLAAPAPAAPRASAPSATAPRAAAPRAAAPRAAARLDTVLATIGRGKASQRLTARDVRAAAPRFGLRADSLAPADVREVLEALIDQRVLIAAVALEPRQWAREDSAEYAALAAELELSSALDSAYASERAARAARGEPPLDPVALGAALRDSAMRQMQPVYDAAVFAHVATAFAALPRPEPGDDILERGRKLALAPRLAEADSERVIATLDGEPFTVRDLMREWKAMRILKRPHIESAQQMTDFVNTWLYQRLLRERARRDRVLERPGNAAKLRERAEYLDVRSWTVRHVYSQVPRDSLTLRREYDRDPARWAQPARAEIVRAVLATRASADSAAAALRGAGGRRRETIDERIDAALTARCLEAGPGAVLGPDPTGDAWQVVRVASVQLRRVPDFAEARPRVERAVFEREAEPLLRATLDAMRHERGVVLDEAALRRLTPAPPATPRPAAPPAR